MTVETSSPRVDEEEEEEEEELVKRKKVFVWTAPEAEEPLACEFCGRRSFSQESNLKVHQIRCHINPHYLSDVDIALGQITNFKTSSKSASSTWSREKDGLNGLYRCNFCYTLWDMKEDLADHLRDEHRGDSLEETKSGGCGVGSDSGGSGSGVLSSSTRRDTSSSSSSSSSFSSSSSSSSCYRPDRKCKNDARALVALVVADENFKFDRDFGSYQTPSSTSSSLLHSASLIREPASPRRRASPKKRITGSRRKRRSYCKAAPLDSLQDMFDRSSNKKPFLSTTERDKISRIVHHATGLFGAFSCLSCGSEFEDFFLLRRHKLSSSSPCFSPSSPFFSLLGRNPFPEKDNQKEGSRFHLKTLRRLSNGQHSDYVDKAIISIPETTFNNLHGTIYHLNTVDGKFVQNNPKIRTVAKVKLNLSGHWNTRHVWENGGWELGENTLSWRQYDSKNFKEQLSFLPWNEQRLLKISFDSYVGNSRKNLIISSTSEIRKPSLRKTLLPQLLDLRSVAASSPSKRKQGLYSLNKRSVVLNGEWENSHSFLCSVCSLMFDDLEDVMHHKWEAHPHCLVSHFTLSNNTRLPPESFRMYPQMGRQLKRVNEDSQPINTCSKCSKVLGSSEAFYIHVLTCGGVLDWSIVKKKKRRGRSGGGGLKSTVARLNRKNLDIEAARQQERERRRKRMEHFSKPRPPVIGRFTRQQLKSKDRSTKTLLPPVSGPSIKSKKSMKKRQPPVKTPVAVKVEVAQESDEITDTFNSSELFVRNLIEEIVDKLLDKTHEKGDPYNETESVNPQRLSIIPDEDRTEINRRSNRKRGRRSVTRSASSSPVDRKRGRGRPKLDPEVRLSRELQRRKKKEKLFKKIGRGRPRSFSKIKNNSLNDKSIVEKMSVDESVSSIIEEPPKKTEESICPPKATEVSMECPTQTNNSVDPSKKAEDSVEHPQKAEDYVELPKKTEDSEELPKKTESSMESSKKIEVSLEPLEKTKELLQPSKTSEENSENCTMQRLRRRSASSVPLSASRVFIPLEVKIGVLNRIENGETVCQVAKDLRFPPSTVGTWWKKKDKIKRDAESQILDIKTDVEKRSINDKVEEEDSGVVCTAQLIEERPEEQKCHMRDRPRDCDSPDSFSTFAPPSVHLTDFEDSSTESKDSDRIGENEESRPLIRYSGSKALTTLCSGDFETTHENNSRSDLCGISSIYNL